MYSEIRQKLDKVTGELIESFIDFDKPKVLQFQACLYALHNLEKDKPENEKQNLYSIKNLKELEHALSKYNINNKDIENVLLFFQNKENDIKILNEVPETLKNAAISISNKQGETKGILPISGMIAVTLDLVSNDVKDALIAGQAGERTLRAAERAFNIDLSDARPSKETAFKDTLYSLSNKSKFARHYIGNSGKEPSYLISAKATNHLADLLESSIMLYPEAINNPQVKEAIKTLKALSLKIFIQTSKKLHAAGKTNASSEIEQLANYLSSNQTNDDITNISTIDSALEITENALNYINQQLEIKNILSKQECDDFKELVNKRIIQAKSA